VSGNPNPPTSDMPMTERSSASPAPFHCFAPLAVSLFNECFPLRPRTSLGVR
jgi:hypothetical protein